MTPAIDGYDAVSYHDGGRPVRGSPNLAHEWEGRRWLFASEEHLEMFRADPERYAPAFDGACAFGMSFGKEAEGSPEHFVIQDGKVYLQSTGLVARFFRMVPGRAAAAERHWQERQGAF